MKRIRIKFYIAIRHLQTSAMSHWGTRRRSWLRHCATSHKVAASIPDGVLEFFIGIILPWCRLSLKHKSVPGLFPGGGGKGGRYVGLTKWKLHFPGTSWTSNRPVQGLLYLCCYHPRILMSYPLRIIIDRNQPGSRRSELRSCKILKVEQT